jgi:hypothetical protein
MSIKRFLPEPVIHSNIVLCHSFSAPYLQPVDRLIHSHQLDTPQFAGG